MNAASAATPVEEPKKQPEKSGCMNAIFGIAFLVIAVYAAGVGLGWW